MTGGKISSPSSGFRNHARRQNPIRDLLTHGDSAFHAHFRDGVYPPAFVRWQIGITTTALRCLAERLAAMGAAIDHFS
jgi:hypothetical protein